METFLQNERTWRGQKLVLVVLLIGALLSMAPPAQAAAGDLVISEIMYNPATDPPATDQDDYEYVELFNPTSAPIALAGMSWSSGISGSFTGGTIPPGGYAVVSPDAGATQSQYGVTTVGTYTGKLSNGGETITLLDANGIEVDTVAYDDGTGWPGTPDGNGPSLELLGNALDNSVGSNWAASITPTPGAVNSVVGALIPITNLTATPAAPAPGTPIVITADIAGSSTATMTYKINVDNGDDNPGTPVTMRDDGTGPDAVAGDGNFAATIPAQSSGTLVRYRVDTGAGDGSPDPIDSITYHGLVVDDPVNTSLPVLRWWMGPNDWNDLDQNHRFTDMKFPAVFEFAGTVYDAVTVNIRGGNWARTNYAKQSYSVEAPSGHDFVMPGYFGYPVDEFAMQAERTWLRAHEGWSTYRAAGFPDVESFHVNVQQNNAFFGIYRVQEKLDGTWRRENDLNDGQFFKASSGGFAGDNWDKKDPSDGDTTVIDAFDNLIESSPRSSKTQALYEQADIPNLINYAAVTAILKVDDINWHNYYMYFDENDTERWRIYPWDLDHSFNWAPIRCSDSDPAVDPSCFGHAYLDAMWEVPEFREMYFRRARTLLDTAFQVGPIADDVAAVLNLTGNDDNLDYDKWGYNPTWQTDDLIDDLIERREFFENDPRTPPSQPATPDIVINEIHYNPAGSEPEFVELYNPTNDWIDLSGWELGGAGLTIAGGTVIEPNGYIVFTENDVAFRDFYGTSSSHILAQFPGGLSNGGETIELKNASGTTIDIVTYDNAGQWDSVPDGNGPSLELIAPSLDNTLASSWAASTLTTGSPGAGNAGQPLPDTQPPSINVAAPANSSTHNNAVSINGTVTDNTSVDRVTVKVEDLATGLFWNGTTSAWQSNAFWNVVARPALGTQSVPFTFIFAPPASGNFKAFVSATDTAGNTRRPAETRTFTVTSGPGTTAPTISVDAPFAGTTAAAPAQVDTSVQVSGTATDDQSISRVVTRIENLTTGLYWNDTTSAWQSAIAWTVVNNPAPPSTSFGWSQTFNPPEATGSYVGIVVAFDAARNRSTNERFYFTRGADNVDPTISVDAPFAGTTAAAPAQVDTSVQVSGTATDDQSISRVVTRIENLTTGLYWNDTTSAWQSAIAWTVVNNPAPPSTSFGWSQTFNPPEATGSYVGIVVAFDAARNRSTNERFYFTRGAVAPDSEQPQAEWTGAFATTSSSAPAVAGTTANLTGSASDNQALDRVIVRVRDQSTGQYWNSTTSQWQAGIRWNVVANGGTSASFTLSVPLVAGTVYRGDVVSWDAAGNRNPPPAITWFTAN